MHAKLGPPKLFESVPLVQPWHTLIMRCPTTSMQHKAAVWRCLFLFWLPYNISLHWLAASDDLESTWWRHAGMIQTSACTHFSIRHHQLIIIIIVVVYCALPAVQLALLGRNVQPSDGVYEWLYCAWCKYH